MASADSAAPKPHTGPVDKDGKPLKPCCACPETKKARDNCTLLNGPDSPDCVKFIEAHQECLRSLGFKI
ncbi:Cytochrome c oxidase copper chaperone [Actinomortierella ambigua]|nr:Cytochrome c oxidase copper chaperone [Actinomortierella ambigua]